MYIFIRHGDKQHANSATGVPYPLDSDITEDAYVQAKKIGKDIVSTCGEPQLIISSPYRRTLQTAECIKSVCSTNPTIMIDSNVAEYLGHQKGDVYKRMTSHTS